MKKDEIVIRNMNKFYGSKHALYDINLTIKCGMFGLLGRNGAGKTTLMKVLATLLNKRDGQVTVCGIPIENARRIRSIIGYLPQEFSMYPNMTVIEAMDYLGLLSGMEKSVRRKRSYDLISQVNLTEHYNKKVRALSGGMKRRLGIAQGHKHEPVSDTGGRAHRGIGFKGCKDVAGELSVSERRPGLNYFDGYTRYVCGQLL